MTNYRVQVAPGVAVWTVYPPDQRASCHPTRKQAPKNAARLCRECVIIAGVLGLGKDKLPGRVEGVTQHVVSVISFFCPKCRAPEPMWVRDEAMGCCRMCGADQYVTIGTPIKPQGNRGAKIRAGWRRGGGTRT